MQVHVVISVVLVAALAAADMPPEIGVAAARNAERYVAAGVGELRIAEVERIAAAAASAVGEFPLGHSARDELRGLRSKLLSLREVAGITEPYEWDSMLSALLEAEYYGIDDLSSLLRMRADTIPPGEMDEIARQQGATLDVQVEPSSSMGCEEDHVDEDLTRPRRLADQQSSERQEVSRQQRQGHPPQEQLGSEGPAAAEDSERYADAAVPNARRSAVSTQGAWRPVDHGAFAGDDEAIGYFHLAADSNESRTWIGGMVWGWRRWLFDRPPPWERDCDCCFAE